MELTGGQQIIKQLHKKKIQVPSENAPVSPYAI